MSEIFEEVWNCAKNGDVGALVEHLARVNGSALNFERRGFMCVNFTTPLMIAAWEGHQQIVQMLIEAGADVNYKDSEAGGTALIRASWNGHTDIVRVLMEAAADVNAQRQDGSTALMFATSLGHPGTERALLEAGADVNAQEQDDWTALMSACQSGHAEIVRLLLDAGADRTLLSGTNRTAAEMAKSPEIRAIVDDHRTGMPGCSSIASGVDSKALASAEEYDALDTLAANLEELRAMDVTQAVPYGGR